MRYSTALFSALLAATCLPAFVVANGPVLEPRAIFDEPLISLLAVPPQHYQTGDVGLEALPSLAASPSPSPEGASPSSRSAVAAIASSESHPLTPLLVPEANPIPVNAIANPNDGSASSSVCPPAVCSAPVFQVAASSPPPSPSLLPSSPPPSPPLSFHPIPMQLNAPSPNLNPPPASAPQTAQPTALRAVQAAGSIPLPPPPSATAAAAAATFSPSSSPSSSSSPSPSSSPPARQTAAPSYLQPQAAHPHAASPTSAATGTGTGTGTGSAAVAFVTSTTRVPLASASASGNGSRALNPAANNAAAAARVRVGGANARLTALVGMLAGVAVVVAVVL